MTEYTKGILIGYFTTAIITTIAHFYLLNESKKKAAKKIKELEKKLAHEKNK